LGIGGAVESRESKVESQESTFDYLAGFFFGVAAFFVVPQRDPHFAMSPSV
jgi:hypothetical protein